MNHDKDPQAMGNLLSDHGDSGLRRIVRNAQRLLAMERIFMPCLPENLRSHCRVAQITATQLTVLVENAAWLMPLRYLKPQLLQQLKKHPQCTYLQDIQWQIQPAQWQPEKPAPPLIPRTLSIESKTVIQSIAESVTNPLLKNALMKLSAP